MTTSDKINYLNDTKQAIKQAIIDKGVDVSKADTFRSYAEKISLIEGGGSVVVELKENFDVYRAYDVNIDENRIASNFSQYAWILGKIQETSASVVNVTTKLKLTNVSTLQSSLFAIVYVKNGKFGVWENDSASEHIGSITIKTNTWYWIQCIFDISNGTYNHYVLEDNEDRYTLSNLPPVNEWLLNIGNGTRTAPTTELISIGNNSQEWNGQYIRGSIDLNNTKITLTDGTIWTPYSEK